jgi:predicted nucleic acid-binding protein
LSGYAAFEFYSVLTRLPSPKRLDRTDALRLAQVEFPESRFLPEAKATDLLDECVSTGISGGMVYDALVAACARHHGLTLLTCDIRAEETYRLLGVTYSFGLSAP